ncbi:MAG: NAD(P)/FAD-dependent oxidoreductase [Chitinophagaceae bacterium]
MKPTVIIIGAGAAGLMAATELCNQYHVIILEALPRIGGRIHSIKSDDGIIEAGAEFVHGNLPVTQMLLKKAGIDYVEISGEMYRKKDGHLAVVKEMTEGWDRLMQEMNQLKEDCTMEELLQKHFIGPENELLRKNVQSYAAGFDLADISKVSVKALCDEWNAEEEENYRIPAGYSALINFLQHQSIEAGVSIQINSQVKTVQWERGVVKLQTINGQQYTVDKLLVTVPISILQQSLSKGHIEFLPVLDLIENNAVNIGFGAVIKVILQFRKAFWQEDAGFILSNEIFPTWWTQLPDKIPRLTGWVGGPPAAAISNDTDSVILQKALASLAAIFNIGILDLEKELVQSWVFNWQKSEFVIGGYSYPTLNAEAAKSALTTPIEQTLFFAGEALYSGDHPGTVEAALDSGMRAASLIKKANEHSNFIL